MAVGQVDQMQRVHIQMQRGVRLAVAHKVQTVGDPAQPVQQHGARWRALDGKQQRRRHAVAGRAGDAQLGFIGKRRGRARRQNRGKLAAQPPFVKTGRHLLLRRQPQAVGRVAGGDKAGVEMRQLRIVADRLAPAGTARRSRRRGHRLGRRWRARRVLRHQTGIEQGQQRHARRPPCHGLRAVGQRSIGRNRRNRHDHTPE